MKLYQSMGSPFAARVRLLMYIKNLDIEFAAGDWMAAFKAIAPTGRIPTLELDDGTMIPESETICEYLEEVYPEPSAFPVQALDRVNARLMARYYDIYVLQALTPIVEVLSGGAMPPAAKIDQAVSDLNLWLQRMNDLLGSGPFVAGDRLSYADGVLIPAILNVRMFKEVTGLPIAIDEMPKLAGYTQAVTAADPLAAKIDGELAGAYASASDMIAGLGARWKQAQDEASAA